MSDNELINGYVLISRKTYFNSVRALHALDIISDILDRCHNDNIPDMIRLVLGKTTKGDLDDEL